MGMKAITLVVLLLFAAPVFVSGQQSDSNSDQTSTETAKAKVGTYQIVITSSKQTPAFTDELLVTIEQNRKEDEIVYLDLQPGVRITILPRTTINAPGFVPLEEIVYQ